MKKNHRGRRMPYFFGQAATLALAFSMSAPMSAEEAGLLHFDMPAQSLDDALAELADRSGLKLLYRTDWVLGRKIRPLAGDYTPKQALEIMLEHSGLNYRFTDERSVTLEKEHQTGMDGLMKWVASNDYRVDFAANTDEEAYTGPVEQVDMTVQGEEWNSYNVPNSSSATRTNSLLLQTPMSIQVLPRALLDDQQTITIAESLRNVSGVVPRTPFVTPNFEPTLIRGFSAQQLIDGFTQYLNAGDQGSMVNIERIEVVKGANAVLYAGGNGSPVGGVVNLVSKLPKPEAFYEVGVKSGLYDFAQPYVDLNRPINDNVLFRFTGEYTHNQSHIDVLETDRFNLNPTVTFTDNDATRLTLQGKFSRWEQQDYQGLPAVGTLTGDFRTRPELFIGPADIDKSNSEFYGIWGTLEHRLDSVWSVTAKGRYSHSKFDTLAQNVVGADGFGADQPFFAPSTWGLINSELAQEQEERSFQAYATAEFEVGPSRNTVLLGADYSELDDNGFMDFDFPPIATVDLTDPVFLLPYDFPGARLYNQLTKNITYGGYLQWQSTLYDRLHLLASVRRGIVNTRFFNTTPGFESNYESDVGRFLPNVGAVVDIVEGFSVYASYNEGMRGQGGVNFVSTPRPALSDQIEVGIKFDLGGKLSGQLSAFEIQRQNIAITDFTDPQFRSVAKGQQRSRGIETNMTWQATDGLNVLGSYAYTEAEFTDSLAGVPEGNELPGVPRHSGRFWVNYAFQDELLRGLSVGTGIYAQSGTYLSKQNLFKSDAYYTMDATVAYKANGYKLGLSIKNLTDEDYFQRLNYFGTRVAPAQGTTVYFSGALTF